MNPLQIMFSSQPLKERKRNAHEQNQKEQEFLKYFEGQSSLTRDQYLKNLCTTLKMKALEDQRKKKNEEERLGFLFCTKSREICLYHGVSKFINGVKVDENHRYC